MKTKVIMLVAAALLTLNLSSCVVRTYDGDHHRHHHHHHHDEVIIR